MISYDSFSVNIVALRLGTRNGARLFSFPVTFSSACPLSVCSPSSSTTLSFSDSVPSATCPSLSLQSMLENSFFVGKVFGTV